MKRLILHIGHSKCASSTIQTFLSLHPILPLATLEESRALYIAGNGNGIFYGSTVRKLAEKTAERYLTFPNEILENPALFSDLISKISSVAGDKDTVILSNEHWSNIGVITPTVLESLRGVSCEIDVFMVCRPPVDWFNAAWWQWGVWAGEQKAALFEQFQEINFWKAVSQWSKSGIINRIKVVEISQDPLNSFLSFANVAIDNSFEFASSNSATDFDILRHLIINKEHYGRDIHRPAIEFRLNRLLKFRPQRPPNVASRSVASRIMQNSIIDNACLIELIEGSSPKLHPEVVKKYLDPSIYEDLPDEILAQPSQPDYSDEFVLKLIETILSLGKEIEDLRK